MNWEVGAALLTAVATAFLAYFTWRLATATRDLVVDSHEAATEQLKLAKKQSQLKILTDRLDVYDGPRVRSARYRYAGILLGSVRGSYGSFPLEVLDFFDDLGLLLKNDYVEVEILWSMFSDQAINWWAAAQKDIIGARKEDETYYENFAYLVERMDGIKTENPTSKDVEDFLQEERETLGSMPAWS